MQQWNQSNNLNEIVNVRNKTIDADFHEHHESSADVLANFRILVVRQEEKILHTAQSAIDIIPHDTRPAAHKRSQLISGPPLRGCLCISPRPPVANLLSKFHDTQDNSCDYFPIILSINQLEPLGCNSSIVLWASLTYLAKFMQMSKISSVTSLSLADG